MGLYDKLIKMSTSELKQLYIDSDDNPIKRKVIRQIIKDKIRAGKKKNLKQTSKVKTKKVRDIEFTDDDFLPEAPVEPDDDIVFNDRDFEDCWYEDEQKDYDDKFLEEIERDKLNNNLSSRMMAEVEMRRSKNKKIFVAPYEDMNMQTYDEPINDKLAKKFRRK